LAIDRDAKNRLDGETLHACALKRGGALHTLMGNDLEAGGATTRPHRRGTASIGTAMTEIVRKTPANPSKLHVVASQPDGCGLKV